MATQKKQLEELSEKVWSKAHGVGVTAYIIHNKGDYSMDEQTTNESGGLVKIIATAIQIPGVKVNRENFLLNTFKNEPVPVRNKILEHGPVRAGIGRRKLERIAEQVINTRTIASSTASFLAGLPGGLAMAATIPADTLQFFGVALRLAQELSYLYGEDDLWVDGDVNMDRVTSRLVVYCGVMFGVGGASAAIRVVSSALGKQALKKIPQIALTKTFYYPIVKSIAKAVGVKMTKGLFAKGVSKAIPIVGGVISGGLTFVSMRPMGKRLAHEFDEIHFDYSVEEFKEDWATIVEESDMDYEDLAAEEVNTKEDSKASFAAQIKEAKELLDAGIITQEEFDQIKEKLISNL